MPDLQLAPHALAAVPVSLPTDVSLENWLRATWDAGPAPLLAHALDGVAWGWITGETLLTAPRGEDSPWPLLRWETLLDLRVFAPSGELRLWRTGNGVLRAVRMTQVEGDQFAGFIDATYLLLGSHSRERNETFDVRTSRSGDEHAVPRSASHLKVRHSYTRDQRTGLLRVAEHRWLALLDTNRRPLKELP